MRFGFCPRFLAFSGGDLSVETLSNLESSKSEVMNSGLVEGDWVYSPPLQLHDMFSGEIRPSPRSGRIFGLPKTHELTHRSSNDPEQLRFLIWMLGFILGMRLTDTERGFLDATTITPGTLHDIVWMGHSDEKALVIADEFWRKHIQRPDVSMGITGIVHSLFLSETPTLLDFEVFTYLYIALDGCYAVWTNINGSPPRRPSHRQRIGYVCEQVGRPVPDWADNTSGVVAGIRNAALHEGLFFDAPLGFQAFGNLRTGQDDRYILLEMQNLVCRLICAIVGFDDRKYITSDLGSRQRYGVTL